MASELELAGLAMSLAVMLSTASVGPPLSEPPQATKANKIAGMTARRMASPVRTDTTIRGDTARYGRASGASDSYNRAGARCKGRPSTVFSLAIAIRQGL